MFYTLSKIVWALINPVTILGILAFASALGVLLRRRRIAAWLAVATAVYVAFVATVPIGAYANLALERRFPANPPLPESVTGIVVLGGSVDPVPMLAYGHPSVGGSFDRVLAFAALASRYPNARLVYSGGRHRETSGPGEAAAVSPILRQLGVDTARVIIESDSRNTYQNAVMSFARARPDAGDTWVLVTSADHMPRAMGAFRQAGWPASTIAYPVDHQSLPDARPRWFAFDLRGALGQLERALHEIAGLAAYRWTGRSAALFPAPVTADIENHPEP